MEIQPLRHLNVDNDGLEIWLLFRLSWVFPECLFFACEYVGVWVWIIDESPCFSNPFSQPLVPRENITAWMNAIGLVITALPVRRTVSKAGSYSSLNSCQVRLCSRTPASSPLLQEPYWIVLHDRIVSVIGSPALTSETEWAGYPFALLDFTACHQSYSEMNCSYVLALAHAVWHHSSIGQLSLIPK